jgi:hypothetical protein
LHGCPRKYQLYKLGSEQVEQEDTAHFAYGHAVGAGIQSVISGDTRADTIWAMFLAWDTDLLRESTKDNKSFFNAVFAVDKFAQIASLTSIKDYKLATIKDVNGNDAAAVELSFRISLPNGFSYVGYVDAVLVHKTTEQLMVLELKTTGMSNVNEATYKNSAQAIGYSIVLDAISPDASSYDVMYLIYKSKQREFEYMPFTKSYSQRAMWIQALLLDIELVERYEAVSMYPQYGENCYSFFRQCEYYGLCGISTERLISPPPEQVEEVSYTIDITLTDLIDSQIARGLIT